MKKYVLSALTAACLFALTTGLRAQEGTMTVHVDQDFVAVGKTFPAGTYRFVPDLLGTSSRSLTIRGEQADAAAIVIPMIFEGRQIENPHVTFERTGNVNYLSEIVTPLGVYTVAPSQRLTKFAKAKGHDTMSASGTN